MDPSQEELEFLGFMDMCGESINIISSCKKIFLQITLTLILPFSIIFLSHSGISTLLLTKIVLNLDELGKTKEATSSYNEILDVLSIEYIEYWVTELVYSTFLVVFSLLSTSTVIYTVACLYSYKQATYEMVMSFALQVGNRLMITFLYSIAILLTYNILTSLTLVILATQFRESDTKITRVILSAIYMLYFIGYIYISVIWQLASAISVLEESYGFQAIAKSKALIKGEMGIAAAIFVEINLCLSCIHLLFDKFVVLEETFGLLGTVGFGVSILVLRSLLFLFGLVVQTVIYFECKFSMNNFPKFPCKSEYLNIYLSSYVPLESIIVEI